jgi:hypothetical protein
MLDTNYRDFDLQSYEEMMNQFPNIAFDDFQKIPSTRTRANIAQKNKILKTDAYNRTMDYTKAER